VNANNITRTTEIGIETANTAFFICPFLSPAIMGQERNKTCVMWFPNKINDSHILKYININKK
jgi:hypothetical protein